MAKRTQTAKKTAEIAPDDVTTPQPVPEASTQAPEQPVADKPERKLLQDPFPYKTDNAHGALIHFQHSRQAGEFQIRFGDGTENDKPSDDVRAFIKSHKIEIKTKDGGKKEVQLFHWNDNDRAWGMRINQDDPETSRQTAKRIYDETVKLVAQERKAAQTQSAGVALGA